MNLLGRLRGNAGATIARHDSIAVNIGSLGELYSAVNQYGGQLGPYHNPQPNIEANPLDLVEKVHHDHGPVPAAVTARMLLVGQFYPKWRSETTGNIFGKPNLSLLQRPQFYPRTELYRRAELDASYSGTAYFYRTRHRGSGGEGIRLIEPWRCAIVVGTDQQIGRADAGSTLRPEDIPDAYLAGYRINVGTSTDPVYRWKLPGEMTHWAPEPDPESLFIGASWVRSVLRDIKGDKQTASHIDSYLERGAIPGLAVMFNDPQSADELEGYRKVIEQYHSGPSASGRTLVLAGAQVQAVGSDLNSMALKDLTAGFETRIAARSRVPATILGIREGLAGSALNAGNYQSARRMWGDGWVTPTLESLAASLETLLKRPANSELWYDPDRLTFLQEDAQDAATIGQTHAGAIMTLINAGFEPDAAVEAVTGGKMDSLIGTHTGLASVQLQPDEGGTGGAVTMDVPDEEPDETSLDDENEETPDE